MTAPKDSLSNFKIGYGIYALSAYGFYSNLHDLFYLEKMYSCVNGFNYCESEILANYLSSDVMIFALHILKTLSFVGLLFPKLIKISLITALSTSIYFVLLNANVYSPEMPYINFLIINLLLTSWKKDFFEDTYRPFMTVVYFSYSFSGFYKFNTPAWINGQFMSVFLGKNHLTYAWVDNLRIFPIILVGITYVGLFSELLACLSVANRFLRTFFWFNLTLMHIFLFFVADLKQVSLAMMVVHVFLLDQTTWSILCNFLHNLKNIFFKPKIT